jgi:glycosyltransferase involved in cell wall biosynthesis
MKIAFLSFYSGLVDRGVETYVHEVATRLTDLGDEVTVYQNGKSRQQTNYPVVYLPSLYLIPPFETSPDIIIPTNGRVQAVASRIWSVLHRKKYLSIGQSGLGADDKLNLFTFPDVFIGLTDYQCEWARKINPLIKTVRIGNGVDLKKFSPQTAGQKFGLPSPVVLNVSALEPIKRLDLLINAVAKTDFSLCLVGTGSLKDELAAQGEKLLGSARFRLLSLPHDQIPSAYTGADIFAYTTSPWESFGIVMLEALASNRPVVATDDPIRKEILGDAGILADPANPEKFAAALKQAVAANWGDKPQKRAQEFSWDKIANRYHELFTKL